MFVPDDFAPPRALSGASEAGERFRLEPLGPEHNERDHRAWMSSIEHIHRTPGFDGWPWPHEMTLEDNHADLVGHADDFTARRGFTYTVLDAGDDVIGCVYMYPDKDGGHDVHVRSWVRADHADLDVVLRRTVMGWLRTAWPFERIRYAGVDAQRSE